MKFEKKTYNGHTYIQYSDESQNLTFTNAEYFKFNTKSEQFEKIINGVGGFVANMTTRLFRDKNIDVSYIMLCSIPQKYNNYVCAFLYLDKNENIITSLYDNNYFDYKYFKEKFADCIEEEGFVFDLENNDKLKDITTLFYHDSSIDFDFTVQNNHISYDNTLIYNNIDILQPKLQEKLQKLNAQSIHFTFDCNPINFISLKGIIMDDHNNPLKVYQVQSGIHDKNEYIKFMQTSYEEYSEDNVDTDVYEFHTSLDTARNLADKLQIAG